MKSHEFITELKKKSSEPEIPYNPYWDMLSHLKENAAKKGEQMAGTLQLFVPRRNPLATSRRDIRLQNLANRNAYDDQGNISPEYEKREQGFVKDISGIGAEMQESAPTLIPGKSFSPPGSNKPLANLWTSTARQFDDNTYTSDWVRYIYNAHPDWMADVGYLYKIKPGALILELSDFTARKIVKTFQGLGSMPQFTDDDHNYGNDFAMSSKFPWDQVVKHFDAVWCFGGTRGDFTYGWDCESTAWLSTELLRPLGKVNVNQFGLSSHGDYS